MKSRIVVLALALFMVACASAIVHNPTQSPESPKKIEGMEEHPVYVETYRDTLAAIVEILDSAYYQWAFLSNRGFSEEEFTKRLEKFKKAMPGRLSGLTWEEVMVRYNYALGVCDSSIALPRGVRDRRYDEILRKGIPTGEWTIPGEVTRGGKIVEVTFYCLSWNATEAVILESRYRGGRPVKRSPPNQRIPTARMAIDQVTNYTYSMGGNGNYDVTFAVWARLSSLNLTTFNRGLLDFAVTLINSKGQVVTRTRVVPLAVYFKMAEVATNPGEHFVRGYVNFIELPADNYQVSIEITGSINNSRRETLAMEVPSPKVSRTLGEPTILYSNVPKGDILGKPGPEGDIVYPNPFTQFVKGTELRISQPIDLPPGTYYFRAILIPLPAYSRKKDEATETGPLYVDPIEGEEYPIPVEQWTARMPDSLLHELEKPAPKERNPWHFEATCEVSGGIAFATFPLVLNELPIGRYALTIVITNAAGQPTGKAEMREPIEVIASI